jgi:hypothetical protein
MADIRSDFEAELQVFTDLLRWTDSFAVSVAGLLAILLLVVSWPK